MNSSCSALLLRWCSDLNIYYDDFTLLPVARQDPVPIHLRQLTTKWSIHSTCGNIWGLKSVRRATMKTNMPVDPEYELWVLLHQAVDAMIRARENELRKFGISRIQAAVLFIIKAIDGPATPAEISRWLFREPHTVFGLLVRMEKQGLVRRDKDLERRNMIRVTITEKGEKAFRRSRDMKVIRTILSGISPEQRDNLKPYLETLRKRALKELGVKHQLPFP